MLTNTGTNTYELTITPELRAYYGVADGENVSKIAILFRNSAGNAQTSNFYITVYSGDFTVEITSPENQSVYNVNDDITINAASNFSSNLELFVNNQSIQTASSSISILSSYTFTASGNYDIKVNATLNGTTITDNISVYVNTATVEETLPSGLTNGINYDGTDPTKATLVLDAPHKEFVYVAGSFNGWNPFSTTYQMKKDPSGTKFWIELTGLTAGTDYTYQYWVYDTNPPTGSSEEIKIADPYSTLILDPDNDQYITNYPNIPTYPSGQNGIVTVLNTQETEYTWQVADFERTERNNLVIYEMLIRDFTESSSYESAITRLDYIKELGVNAIELMPVNEFEGNISWGYNPSFYMALDKAYGTKNNFKTFVDECHQRDIAVIVDVVFNHSFGQSPLVQMYWDSTNNRPASDNPYYNQTHNLVDNTSAHWGYDFNHESTYTVNFFNDVLTYWMNEYNIDGFRFDFTKGLSNTLYYGSDNWASTYDADRIANLKAYADHVWANDGASTNDAYVIFEHLSDNNEETELANHGIMLWGNMNHSFNQNTMGWNTDASISWVSHKNRGWTYANLVGYMESHDEERLMVKNVAYGNSSQSPTYDVKTLSTALDRQETAAVVLYAIPGPKMLWQFGELGYDKSINCEADITNGSCRTDVKPSAWTLGYDSLSDRLDLFNVTARMIALKINEAVFQGDFTIEDSYNSNALIKRIYVWDNNIPVEDLKNVVIVANFDVVDQSVVPGFPFAGNWVNLMDETNSTVLEVTDTSAAITIPAGGFIIYGNSTPETLSTDYPVIKSNIKLYPNPTYNAFKISQNVKTVTIHDITGKLISTFEGNFSKGFTFDISNLPQNIYLVKIKSTAGEQATKKLVKM
ncbi:MAG: alpha-amylase family glycosyl hydrolase [Flavobacteriaceae bacterium]